LEVIPLPLPPNEFHEGSCGFWGVLEQIRHVFGLFLAVAYFERPGGRGGDFLRLVFWVCFGLVFVFWGAVRGF